MGNETTDKETTDKGGMSYSSPPGNINIIISSNMLFKSNSA